jgi:hypothetical protein
MQWINKYVSIIALLITYNVASAQYNETIRTGRPGQSIGPFTVGQGIFQLQSGFGHYGIESNDITIQGYLNNTVMRLGLTETFELSTLLEYRTEEIDSDEMVTSRTGLSALDVGMRYHIFTGKGLVPSVGFQFRVRLPGLSNDFEVKDIGPRFVVITAQKLSQTFTLITNWGAAWTGNSSTPIGAYTVNLSFPIHKKLGGFVETFGTIQHGKSTINFDTGFAWLLTNDLQLDLFGGFGNNHGVEEYFIQTGVSWRTRKK